MILLRLLLLRREHQQRDMHTTGLHSVLPGISPFVRSVRLLHLLSASSLYFRQGRHRWGIFFIKIMVIWIWWAFSQAMFLLSVKNVTKWSAIKIRRNCLGKLLFTKFLLTIEIRLNYILRSQTIMIKTFQKSRPKIIIINKTYHPPIPQI